MRQVKLNFQTIITVLLVTTFIVVPLVSLIIGLILGLDTTPLN